jgi:hypothetical protein
MPQRLEDLADTQIPGNGLVVSCRDKKRSWCEVFLVEMFPVGLTGEIFFYLRPEWLAGLLLGHLGLLGSAKTSL